MHKVVTVTFDLTCTTCRYTDSHIVYLSGIAVNMDREKCGTFSSLRWLSSLNQRLSCPDKILKKKYFRSPGLCNEPGNVIVHGPIITGPTPHLHFTSCVRGSGCLGRAEGDCVTAFSEITISVAIGN